MEIVLVGGGGHGLVVAESAMLAGHTIAGVLDDGERPRLAGPPIRAERLGALEEPEGIGERGWIVALGDLAARRRAIDALGGLAAQAATIAHPTAYISTSATLERGVWVGPGAIVHAEVRVRAHAIVNSGAILEHDCDVGENCHVAPGAVLGGGCRVGAETLIGLGSRVVPGIGIGRAAVVGAGAVVVRDVEPETTVVGSPATVVDGDS